MQEFILILTKATKIISNLLNLQTVLPKTSLNNMLIQRILQENNANTTDSYASANTKNSPTCKRFYEKIKLQLKIDPKALHCQLNPFN